MKKWRILNVEEYEEEVEIVEFENVQQVREYIIEKYKNQCFKYEFEEIRE